MDKYLQLAIGSILIGIACGAVVAGIGKLLRRKPKVRAPNESFILPLGGSDGISLHQAYEGILVTGGIGAGKTSGPGDWIARALLRRGCGFHVLTAKTDEYDRWRLLCEQTGRLNDLVRFGPGQPYQCDLLDYSLQSTDIEQSAALLDTLVEVSNRSQGKGDEQFWSLFAQKIFRRAIGSIWFGKGKCSLTDVYEFIASAPSALDQIQDAGWKARSFCFECLQEANTKLAVLPFARDVKLCADFWLGEWPELSDKTRSVGYTMTTNVLDKFLTGPVAQMVSGGKTNITPEDVHRGKIVVTDMSYERWREPGRFFQIIFKLLVQRATLRRGKGNARPVVIWADEAQVFLVPEVDAMTQALARQSRLISVALTQNLPIVYSALGGSEKARHEAEAWVATHSTKLMCANSCKETNEFFSEIIGEHRALFMNGSSGGNEDYDLMNDWMGTGQQHAHAGFSEQNAPQLMPGEFLKLRKGGHEHKFMVDFYAFQSGRRWSNGKTFTKASVRQQV